MEYKALLATMQDLHRIEKLFEDVCKSQETEKYSAKWVYGVYPSKDDFMEYIDNKNLYLLLEDHVLVGSFTITKEEKAYALHLFTIHPEYRGRGLALEGLNKIFEIVKELGGTKLQLDVIKGNLPAENLYLKAGFEYLCEKEVFYEDTGRLDMKFFERIL